MDNKQDTTQQPSPTAEIEKFFQKSWDAWAGNRPHSVELDALKLVAWDFFRHGYASGLREPIDATQQLVNTLVRQKDAALGIRY